MRRHHPFRWLPFLVLATAISVLSQTAAKQHAAGNPAPSAVLPSGDLPTATTLPAAAPASTLITVPPTPPTPSPNATPEEIGDSYQARQRYQLAIAAYSKDPHPTAAMWNKMGIAYQMMFNLKAATHCYQESLHLDSKNPMVYNNLATVYDTQKEYSKAERTYRKALKIKPNSPLILKNLGTNQLVQHKYEKGWKAYEKALRLDPLIFQGRDSPTVSNPTSVKERGAMNYFMARGCVRMGQTECAIEYLRKAINEGYTTIKKLNEDADFASLRDNPAFKQLAAEQQQPQQQRP